MALASLAGSLIGVRGSFELLSLSALLSLAYQKIHSPSGYPRRSKHHRTPYQLAHLVPSFSSPNVFNSACSYHKSLQLPVPVVPKR